jgi:hypothetical protein
MYFVSSILHHIGLVVNAIYSVLALHTHFDYLWDFIQNPFALVFNSRTHIIVLEDKD